MADKRLVQSIIIGLITLFSIIAWFGLNDILSGQGDWLWPSMDFLFVLVFLSLSWLLIQSRKILSIAFFFILASFLIVFGFRLEYLAGLIIAFILFMVGSSRAINEKEVRIKIQTSKIFQRGLPAVLTGLALLIAAAYYFSPLALKSQNQIEIPRPLFNIIIEPILKIFMEQMPISQFSQQFSQQLDMENISDENLKEFLYQTINQEINKYSQPYKKYFPLGLAIGLFFALKAVGIIFMFLAILVGWLIFKILVSIGAIKIQEKAVLKEVIIYCHSERSKES